MLNVNGHDGNGKAAAYKQMRCINQAKRGMFALDVEWLGMGQLSGDGYTHSRIVELDLCGTSGVALHYLALSRAIDLLLALPEADPSRVAVAGLSGGGWQTIFFSPLDTRVTLCNPVAGYSSFLTRSHFASDLGDFEQTPCDMATVADYTHMTALMAPRPCLLTFNAQDDCCFRADHALAPLLEASAPIYRVFNKESSLRSFIGHDPGSHNFERINREALYQMLGEHFAPGSSTDAKEIASESEIKTRGEFEIPLPEGNATIHSLALELAKALPKDPGGDPASRREKLKAIVRVKDMECEAVPNDREEQDRLVATFWKLKLGKEWTVPAVEIAPEGSTEVVLVVADSGRAGAAELVRKLLGEKKSVVAFDPFFLGESRFKDHAYLYALLATAVGDRPLGLQASETGSVARWAKKRFAGKAVSIDSIGPRSSAIALVAAALEPGSFKEIWLHAPLGSLKEAIEKKTYADAPELFCFGLLEFFDVKSISALAEADGAEIHRLVE